MITSNTRRALFVGASIGLAAAILAPLVGCATTGSGGLSFDTIQAYVADAGAAVDKLVPLIAILDPAAAATLRSVQASADAAVAIFAKITDPTSAAGTAQTVLNALNEALSIAEAIPGLPPTYAAAIAAAQLLIAAVGSFFSLAPSTATAALGAQTSYARALSRYRTSADPLATAAQADAQVRAFIASS